MYKFIQRTVWCVSADNNKKIEVNIFEQNATQNAGKHGQLTFIHYDVSF